MGNRTKQPTDKYYDNGSYHGVQETPWDLENFFLPARVLGLEIFTTLFQ